jgi:hypothetical protein
MKRRTGGEILRRGVYPEPFGQAQDRLRRRAPQNDVQHNRRSRLLTDLKCLIATVVEAVDFSSFLYPPVCGFH